MELEKGCILIDNSFDYKMLGFNVREWIEVCYEFDKNVYTFSIIIDDIKNGKYKIIGKEPTILDAMEVLSKNDRIISVSTNQGNFLVKSNDLGDDESIVDVDYSKPHIKDQNEEFINLLHKLLQQ